MKIFTLLSTILFATTLNKSNSQCTLPANLPYTQDFQSCTPPDLPPCTINQTIYPDNGGPQKWITGGSTNIGLYVYVDVPYLNGTHWFYLPMMYFDAAKSYKITYKYSSDNPDPVSAPILSVSFGSCAADTCMTNLIFTGTITNTSLLTATKILNPIVSGNYFIGFNHQDKQGYPGNSTVLDNIVVELNEPLPVNLSPLSYINSSGFISLLWQSYSEHNNQHFEIQQSAEGTQFQRIGQVASKAPNGNSQNILAYDFFVSPALFSTGQFFRLKQIDRDGKSSFSNIINIGNITVSGRRVIINGNPVNDLLSLSVTSTVPQKAQLNITDQTGRQVYKRAVQLSNGANILQENLNILTKGIYYLTITDMQGKPVENPVAFTKQ